MLRVEVSGTQRITYTQAWDAENRLVAVTTPTGTVQFRYDGDGNRVLRIGPEGTTIYIGDHFEKQGAVVTKYYYAAGQRMAVRVGGALYFLHGDHLGSATVATDGGGNWVGEARYTPYGEMRRDYPRGVIPTDRLYTGQQAEAFGLYDYQARYYSPGLGRFVSADTIVPSPGKPQTLNRYAYGGNNPILYNDPDGRCGPLCGTFLLVGTLAALTIALDEYILEPVPGPGEYNARESYRQAVGLVRDWLYNIEPRERSFGPESPLTQDIMHDPGMIAFRQKWAEAGYPLPWSWEHKRDEREKGPMAIRVVRGMGTYAVENAQLLLTAIGMESDTPAGPIDAVGGIIGSLDRISVYPAGRGMVKIEVRNEMNWESGSRIPGTNRFIADWRIPGTDITVREYLEARGWGKTPLGQTFYWWEPLPGASWRMRPGR